MVGRRRRIEHKRHKPVQKFNGNFELSARSGVYGVLPSRLPQAAIDILGVLGAEGVAGEAAIIAGVVKSDVTYWKNRFVAAGALIPRVSEDPFTGRVKAGTPKYYDLTSYGSKLLTGSDNVLRLPVVFEDHPVKFRVLRWERKKPDGSSCIDWKKLGQPRNWNKMGFEVTGVRVVKTSRNVIIHPGQMKGFNVDALEVDSGRIVERVRFTLEVKFGMQLADDCVALHSPRWQVFRPECRKWMEAGTCEVRGVGGLDASPKPGRRRDPLHRVPHLEFEDKRHAAVAAAFPVATDPAKRLASAAPMFPLVLEDLHLKVSGLVSQVEALTVEVGSVKKFESQVGAVLADFEKLATAFSRLENLDRIGDNLQKVVGLLTKFLDLDSQERLATSQVSTEEGINYVT